MSNLSRRAVLATIVGLGAIGPIAASRAGAENLPSETGSRVALRGYDPVSYFEEGRPEKGLAEFSAAFDDAVYWFKNADHQSMFVADPVRYAPEYGGFCAIGVSRGRVLDPDPEAWTISDGKLYVFHAKAGVPLFQQQGPDIVAQATANWPELVKRP